MRYNFTGKNMSVFDDFKAKAERKIGRIQKLVPDDVEVFVTLSKIRHQFKMEVSVPLHKRLLRAEVISADLESALDSVVDILEKQIVKYKGRLRERKRRDTATLEEVSYLSAQEEVEENSTLNIHRTKRFALKPMDAQEAVMEMELLGHSFFVFRNGENDEVNVVYKRDDGEYGLIEPT